MEENHGNAETLLSPRVKGCEIYELPMRFAAQAKLAGEAPPVEFFRGFNILYSLFDRSAITHSALMGSEKTKYFTLCNLAREWASAEEKDSTVAWRLQEIHRAGSTPIIFDLAEQSMALRYLNGSEFFAAELKKEGASRGVFAWGNNNSLIFPTTLVNEYHLELFIKRMDLSVRAAMDALFSRGLDGELEPRGMDAQLAGQVLRGLWCVMNLPKGQRETLAPFTLAFTVENMVDFPQAVEKYNSDWAISLIPWGEGTPLGMSA